MNRLLIILFIALFSFSCDDVITDSFDENIVVKSGSFFGECIGYCSRELDLTKNEIIYSAATWNSSQQKKSYENILSRTEWESLKSKIDLDSFGKLDSVIGCPDCADGGGEWIEIKYFEKTKKVT